eukprot:gene9777-biopygen2745
MAESCNPTWCSFPPCSLAEKLEPRLQQLPQGLRSVAGSSVGFIGPERLSISMVDDGSYQGLVQHAKKMCCMFGSTSLLCESLFSKMKHAKSRLRSRMTDQHLEGNLRLPTSTILPNIEKLAKDVQHQVAH